MFLRADLSDSEGLRGVEAPGSRHWPCACFRQRGFLARSGRAGFFQQWCFHVAPSRVRLAPPTRHFSGSLKQCISGTPPPHCTRPLHTCGGPSTSESVAMAPGSIAAGPRSLTTTTSLLKPTKIMASRSLKPTKVMAWLQWALGGRQLLRASFPPPHLSGSGGDANLRPSAMARAVARTEGMPGGAGRRWPVSPWAGDVKARELAMRLLSQIFHGPRYRLPAPCLHSFLVVPSSPLLPPFLFHLPSCRTPSSNLARTLMFTGIPASKVIACDLKALPPLVGRGRGLAPRRKTLQLTKDEAPGEIQNKRRTRNLYEPEPLRRLERLNLNASLARAKKKCNQLPRCNKGI